MIVPGRWGQLFDYGMSVAKSTRDLPMAVFQAPYIDKTSFTDHPVILRIGMQEPMSANLNGPIIGYGMNFKRTRYKLANKLAAYILSSRVQHGFGTDR